MEIIVLVGGIRISGYFDAIYDGEALCYNDGEEGYDYQFLFSSFLWRTLIVLICIKLSRALQRNRS